MEDSFSFRHGGRVRNVEALAKLVRTLRKDTGLDQITAAGLTGVGTRFLSELERGKPTLVHFSVRESKQAADEFCTLIGPKRA